MVFNWLLFAFSGYLSTDQTLQLWDRILGYNSLQLLPGKSLFMLVFYLILAESSARDSHIYYLPLILRLAMRIRKAT